MLHKKKSTPLSILLIQGTLHPVSYTALLIEEAGRILTKKNILCDVLDLRSTDLDLYDGREIKEYGEITQNAIERIQRSDILIFSVPAYAPRTPGTLKNLISLSAYALPHKRAGLICYSETGANYEASLDVIKLLSNHSVEILQPVVHATRETFRDGIVFDDVVLQLIEELIEAALTPPIQ